MKSDEAMVAQLQSAFHAAEVNLSYTDIVSPIDGTVVWRNAEIGQTVAAASEISPLFFIAADLTLIHVDSNVGEKDIGAVTVGDQSTFTVEAFPNRSFAGVVTQIRSSPQTIESIATYDVVIRAPNPALLLNPGMKATVQIVVDRRDNVLRAPEQALSYSPRNQSVNGGPKMPPDGWSQLWILREGKATAIAIQLGLDDGFYTEIVEGDLQPGDELIIGERGDTLE